MVIGGCAVDITCTVKSDTVTAQQQQQQQQSLGRSSYPGRLERTLGGVGCNMARVAHQCGIPTVLVSVTGDDADGQWIRRELERNHMVEYTIGWLNIPH